MLYLAHMNKQMIVLTIPCSYCKCYLLASYSDVEFVETCVGILAICL